MTRGLRKPRAGAITTANIRGGVATLNSTGTITNLYADGSGTANLNDSKASKGNTHPTVKATELMRWLCRLITPPGGMVLDMFCGTGSTGKAAILEGFNFTGIDQDAEYCRMARARCAIVRPEPKQASFAIPTLNVAPVPAETGPKQATFGDL